MNFDGGQGARVSPSIRVYFKAAGTGHRGALSGRAGGTPSAVEALISRKHFRVTVYRDDGGPTTADDGGFRSAVGLRLDLRRRNG